MITASASDFVGSLSSTALSSAIDASPVRIGPPTSSETSTPTADALTLQRLAKSVHQDNGCSRNPVDYGHCVVAAVKAVGIWVQRWGHSVLDILSLASFAPPPFQAVGVSAAVVNPRMVGVSLGGPKITIRIRTTPSA